MTKDNTAPTVRLRDLSIQVSRRWLVLVSSMAVVTAACLGAGSLVDKEYTASASLAVSPLTTNPFSTGAVNQQINIVTERAILGSNEVARLASEKLGLDAAVPNVLLKQVDVAAPSGSQVLEVRVTMPDPQRAADYANAMAEAYLQFRADGAAAVAAGYVTALDDEIARLSAVQNATAQQAQRLSDAIQQRQNFLLVADSPGRIIGVAKAPAEPSSLSQSSLLAAGLVGGLMLGIAAALLRERLDRKIRSRDRLSETCNIAALELAHYTDPEGMRWILRALARTKDEAAGPMLVSTMPLTGKKLQPRKFVDSLAATARASGLSVLVVRPSDINLADVDQGWPEPAVAGWQHLDLVILETDQRIQGARRARLSDHLDAVVILAAADSSLKDLRRLESDLKESPASRLPVLLGKHFNEEPAKDPEEGLLLSLPASSDVEQTASLRKEPA